VENVMPSGAKGGISDAVTALGGKEKSV